MKLIKPTADYLDQICSYREEFLRAGDSMDGCGRLRRFEDARDWLEDSELFEHPDTVPDGSVPTTQYLCVRESDDRLVGMLQIRHRFDEYLEKYAGHIGYSVRPSERRKGYAEWMLSRALPECRRLGIEHVLVCCIRGNEGSRRTILKNGGVYESTVYQSERGRELERYWIDLEAYRFDPRKHIAEICLRPVQMNDAEPMHLWMNDPGTVKYLGYGFLNGRKLEDIQAEIRLRSEGEFTGQSFSILNEEDTEYLGQVNLMLPDERAKTAEISIALMPDMHGQGIGRKALLTVLRWGFDGCGYNRLYARCFSANIPAVKLFESVGFVPEGTLREHMMTCEGLTDVRLYGMLKDEFRQLYQ